MQRTRIAQLLANHKSGALTTNSMCGFGHFCNVHIFISPMVIPSEVMIVTIITGGGGGGGGYGRAIASRMARFQDGGFNQCIHGIGVFTAISSPENKY